MAERTVSVGPLPAEVGVDRLQQEFSGLGIERVVVLAERGVAYVQFSSSAEAETLGNKYPDCRVAALGNAEIGFVEEGFRWPVVSATARAECLVVVSGCDRLPETPEARIRQIFKKYAIDKVVRFEETGEVVLEFHSQEDLELIELEFEDYRVPDLGPHAQISVDNAFPLQRFLDRYLQRNQLFVLEPHKKESPPPPKAEPTRESDRATKEAESRRKMEEMEREIREKEKARKSEAEALERARREKEERDRVERYAREKKEREDRERREQIELEERRRREEAQRTAEQEQQRRDQDEKRRKAEEAELQRRQEKEEREARQLAERIAAIKAEVEEEESRMHGRQEEPELETILSEEREGRRKEVIRLTEINELGGAANPQPAPPLPSRPAAAPLSARPAVGDYKTASGQLVLLVVGAWLLYMLSH